MDIVKYSGPFNQPNDKQLQKKSKVDILPDFVCLLP